MTREHWTDVDRYLVGLLVPPDPELDATLRSSQEANLPAINVAPNQGKLLHLLLLANRARTVLEIGTLAGYSTIWLARALTPEGRLVSLEIDPRRASLARANVEAAGLSEMVEIIVGPAAETIPKLVAEQRAAFDVVFIDADKPNTSRYFDSALELTHVGSLIIVDNVVRAGKVADPAHEDPDVVGMRRFLERLAREPRVSATAVQTVGSKGHDGFVLAVVTSEAE